MTLPLLCLVVITASAQANLDTSKPNLVFRDPFILRLAVDKDHYYEEHFEKIPYVANNDIYLFAGETFGLSLRISDGEISEVSYQPDLGRADLLLKFSQEKKLKNGMMLVIQSKIKKRLYLDAVMTIPQSKEIHRTNIVPVEAGLSDYESWPHPIVQLVLRNLRFSEKVPTH